MRKATLKDIDFVSDMLFQMYNEVISELMSDDIQKYKELATIYIKENDVWIDNRGIFVIRDETNPVLKVKMWNGVAVYIKKEYRKTKALKDFYEVMFNNYDGIIMGYTEAKSEHNKVLMKRHKLLGYVYEMERE